MWEAWSGAGCYEVCRRGSPGHLLSLAAGPWLLPRPFPQTMLGGPPSLLIPPPHPFPCVRKHLLSSGQDGKRKRRATSGQTWPLTLRWQRRSGTGHPGPVGRDVWALAQGEWRASEGPCHGGDCLELPALWRAVPLFLIPLWLYPSSCPQGILLE